MSKTRVPGVNAAGMQPVWVMQKADVTTPITADTATFSLPLLQAGVKVDCYMDFGDFTIDRTANTTTRQRMCQKVAEEIVIGHTIAGTMTVVHDRQAADTEVVNLAYEALPEGGEVVIAVAHGWDQDNDPDATTVVDLWVVTVAMLKHLIATSPDADIKAEATLNGSVYASNVVLSAV